MFLLSAGEISLKPIQFFSHSYYSITQYNFKLFIAKFREEEYFAYI